ncbi:FAD binding domain-containing protein [Planosporangium mesophilum]|uniref:Carbon-monoxide dehydrogenase medium subunit n=1 Tax=Planosporangium mesophilum TaxID=689768 RepID=A0A8J3TB79_9ACTN|nr:xanthine dehydrogenase family protein subunit M [Planosporangium mesophilum]NJC84434.1 xanthine dehydrogenase family protein subunit M [Planosporangium mesophilum]GII23423.1 carbon-monoxide dehydrogenase medium subunit [Planosporangium mesophilum]
MKAPYFQYHRPSSIGEAVTFLDEYGGGARVIAGGQSLVPMMNMRLWRPLALVDINGIDELARIREDGDRTILGALVRYSEIERLPVIAERLPVLAHIVRYIGDRQVRNRGTIGGSLVQGDPTGEMPLACLVLGATVRVVGPDGVREIPLPELYESSYAATLDVEELLTEVVFPRAPQHFAFTEVTRRHNDFAVVSVLATGDRDADGRWRDVRIGLGGVNDTPVLASGSGAALEGSDLSDDAIRAAAELAVEAIDPPTDIRASAEYRRHLVPIHVRRVLTQLRETPLRDAPLRGDTA